jgi:puromycin-sensitive aminopeptidase
MGQRAIVLLGCLLALGNRANAQRLPATVLPEHYRITFTPDFSKDVFAGEEIIQVRLVEPTSTITLNSVELDYQGSSVSAGGTTYVAKVTTDATREMATLAMEQKLQPGPAEIRIRFSGKLNDKLRGFYLARANGRKYATTQFEPTDARRAFPCFDEPAMKATFDISLVVDQGDTGISNGRIISDTPSGPGKHRLRFSTTPRMSSYLVAMAVGDFACLEGEADGVPIRICSTPEKKSLGSFALESAEHILSYYDRYYGIKYPFGKLDVVAVPDFEAGAMENTAAIFYRETYLLIDDKNASVDAHKAVVGVLAHEMAHMWFGDLVTMKWWNDLWLNEGFASWMAHKPIEAWKPEWNEAMDAEEEADGSLAGDSLASTRPIRTKAETSAAINELFDGIAYGKTAAVLRMIEAYVGEEVFRQGVNAYLKAHAYSNATAEDFWSAIAKASGKPVDQIMPTFVNQPGVPLVSVEARCDGDTTAVTLGQQRYFSDRAHFDAGSKELWEIPVCVKSWISSKSSVECVLLARKRQTFQVKGCASAVLLNAGATGYYRSAYDLEALRQMTDSLGKGQLDLTPEERIALVGDEWALVEVGKYKIGGYLALVGALRNDRTRAVLEAALGRLVYIGDYLVNDSDRESYEAWVRDLLRPIAHELGFGAAPDDTDERRNLRATALTILGYTARDPEVIAWARSMVGQYLERPTSVPPTLARVVVELAAINGDGELYEKFLTRMKTANSPEDYYRYFYALASFRDPVLVNRTLEYALSDQVRNQDAANLVGSVMGNPAGREPAWAFVKTHWPDLEKKLTTWSARGVVGSTSSFCDARARDDVQQFFTEHKVVTAERGLQQALESIDDCVSLKSEQETNLAAWLASTRPIVGQ